MPGYLPDSDPFECDTIKEGKACLLESLESHADSAFDFDIPPNRKEVEQEYKDAIRNIKKYGYAIFQGYAYSIQKF